MKSKAILLLCVFLLNTVIGFGCALHMSHPEQQEAAEHHQHEGPSCAVHEHSITASGPIVEQNDACCQGAVNHFVSLAKLLPQPGKSIIQVPVVYIDSYYQFSSVCVPMGKLLHQIPIDVPQRPPTPNIRIVIRSFQIWLELFNVLTCMVLPCLKLLYNF